MRINEADSSCVSVPCGARRPRRRDSAGRRGAFQSRAAVTTLRLPTGDRRVQARLRSYPSLRAFQHRASLRETRTTNARCTSTGNMSSAARERQVHRRRKRLTWRSSTALAASVSPPTGRSNQTRKGRQRRRRCTRLASPAPRTSTAMSSSPSGRQSAERSLPSLAVSSWDIASIHNSANTAPTEAPRDGS